MSEPREEVRIHLLQWRVEPGKIDANLHRAEELVGEASPRRGELILLPEMFPSGFYFDDLKGMALSAPDVVRWMGDLARETGAAVAGSIPESAGNGVVNSLVMVDGDGARVASYAKVHLFPLAGEPGAFLAGDRPATGLWRGLGIGMLICFDLRFPEMARSLCLQGSELIIVSAQWPAARIEHFRDLVRVRAMENQLFVAACNSCGDDGAGLELGGGSIVAGPMGETLGSLGAEEGILSVTIDPAEVSRVRRNFPVLSLRRPRVYGC